MGSLCERSSTEDVSAKNSGPSMSKKKAYQSNDTKSGVGEDPSEDAVPHSHMGDSTVATIGNCRENFRQFNAPFPRGTGITSLVSSPGLGSTCVLAASERGSIALLNYASGKTRLRWEKVHDREINALTTPRISNGHFLSCSRDKKIKLWSCLTGDGDSVVKNEEEKTCTTPLAELSGHTLTVSSIDHHPQGHLVVSGSRDNTVRLWDLERGGEEVFCGNIKLNLVYFVRFLPLLSCVVQGGEDRIIRLWDLRCGQSRSTLVLAHTIEPDLEYFPTCAMSLASACTDNAHGSGGDPYHLITGHNGVNGCGSYIKEWDLRRPDQDAVYTHTEAHRNSITGLTSSLSSVSPLSFLSYSVDSVVNLWEKASPDVVGKTTLRDQLEWDTGRITALTCTAGNQGGTTAPPDLVIGTGEGAVVVLRQGNHPNCHRKIPRQRYRLFDSV